MAVTDDPVTVPVLNPAVKVPVKVPKVELNVLAAVPAVPGVKLANLAATFAADVVAVEVKVRPLTVTA